MKSILRSHLNHSNRIRNEEVMSKIQKLVEIGNRAAGVPVHPPLKCTGTLWPKMTRNESVPVHFQSVPVQVTRNALKCVFSHIFPYVSTPINSILHIHLKTISYSPCKLNYTQIIFQYISFFKIFHDFLPKTILIWVITHTHTKYTNLLGFVLTQPLYFAIKP